MYTAKFFYDALPEWKRKRDPLFVRFLYRPISFLIAPICANHGVKANIVTVISIIVSFIGGALFAFHSWRMSIIGAIFINIWLLLDCVDGNLARNVDRQPYGDFLDALGSYVLAAALGISLGIYCFYCGGGIFEAGEIVTLELGAIASISDLLMRATHQKFKNNSYELEKSGVIEETSDKSERGVFKKIKDRIQLELGIGGILPIMILICAIVNKLDVILIYLTLYNACSCGFIILLYIVKALKKLGVSIK